MALDWSTLPVDLLFEIATKLENIESFIYFSVVCRCWSDISSQIKNKWRGIPVPWILLAEKETENPNFFRKIFNPSNNKCYQLNLPETFGRRCWGTAYGWVVMIERDFNVRLFNPVTKAQILFPSSETIPTGIPHFDRNDKEDLDWFLSYFFDKIIVLKVSHGDHDEFVIMALTRENLVFARHEDQSWTVLLSGYIDYRGTYNKKVVDIVGVDDKVFGLCYYGAIVCWNVKDLLMGEVVKPIDYAPSGDSKVCDLITRLNRSIMTWYLAQTDGDFIMILREKTDFRTNNYSNQCSYKTIGFHVFRLDPREKAWQRIEELGGVTLFIGGNASMSISSTLPKSLQRDCIYFTDDEYQFLELPIENGGHDMGVYDMKCKELRPFYDGGDVRTTFCPPTWFIPQF